MPLRFISKLDPDKDTLFQVKRKEPNGKKSLKCQIFGHYFIFSATLQQFLTDSDKRPFLILATFVGNIMGDKTGLKELKSL